uniref:Phosphotransferase n=1 Tax=Strigamia maritima TaxID=126957 RepID=T1J8Y0_STRMM
MTHPHFPLKAVYFDLIPKEKLKFNFHLSDKQKQNKVEEVIKPFVLTEETYERVAEAFDEQMTLGLMKNPTKKSSFYMLNTFISQFTNGAEEGQYLAIDLGASNLRVNLVKMEDGKIVAAESQHYPLTTQIQQGSGTQLFDYLADCIKDLLEKFNLTEIETPLGFTFSFAMDQKSLDVAYLISWGLSFNCSGVVGKDVVQMLNTSLRKKDVKVQVSAILNDMTGVLVHGIHLDPRTVIGTGIGSGTNCCYIEKASNVHCWNDDEMPTNQTDVVIDTECGAFGDNGALDFIKTEFDDFIDRTSLNPNKFVFEKYTSGNCLGELARLVFVKLIGNGVFFTGKNVKIFNQEEVFKSRMISECEKDFDGKNAEHTQNVLKELGLSDLASDDDIAIIRYVCAVITIRACRLLAINWANLIKRINRPDVTVAVDGSVYIKHPKFHSLITHAICDLLPKQKFRLMLAQDGSGKGAALVAAIVKRIKQNE